MKVSIKREVNDAVWRLTSYCLDEDVDTVEDALQRAGDLLVFWARDYRLFVTHGSRSEMVFEAADSLAQSGVWFIGPSTTAAYTVDLQRECDTSVLGVEVLTVYPERKAGDGEIPPFA